LKCKQPTWELSIDVLAPAVALDLRDAAQDESQCNPTQRQTLVGNRRMLPYLPSVDSFEFWIKESV
jgi:hypothetical protein